MPKRTAVFPGTFDPITSGHLDVIRRGANIFDRLVVAVAKNPGKKALFTADERIRHIRELTAYLGNVEVETFEGMTVDFVKKIGGGVILRGIRTYSDFEYEFQLALANRAFAAIETVFIMASEENSFVRSTMIKEAVSLGADVSSFVPEQIAKEMYERLGTTPPHAVGLRGDEPVR